MIRKLWRRLHAELALLRIEHARRKQINYKRALLKRRVVLPRPHPGAVAGNWPFQGKGPEAKS